MLEAPPDASRPWASASNAEMVDALPYIDEDYGNPQVKAEVDRLVEEEMRRSSKKPADFLKDLPPVPKFNFEVALLFLLVRTGAVLAFIIFCLVAEKNEAKELKFWLILYFRFPPFFRFSFISRGTVV